MTSQLKEIGMIPSDLTPRRDARRSTTSGYRGSLSNFTGTPRQLDELAGRSLVDDEADDAFRFIAGLLYALGLLLAGAALGLAAARFFFLP